MHTKATVKYVREVFVHSGRVCYWKQEIITDSSWQDVESLRWSARRPITAKTYERAKQKGYVCVQKTNLHAPAEVVDFPLDRVRFDSEACRPGIVRLMRRIGL